MKIKNGQIIYVNGLTCKVNEVEDNKFNLEVIDNSLLTLEEVEKISYDQRLINVLSKLEDNKLTLKNKWIGAIYITYDNKLFTLRDKDMYSVMTISLDTVESLLEDLKR